MSIFIPLNVLIKEITSAPPETAALAISVMSVTSGDNFTIKGCAAKCKYCIQEIVGNVTQDHERFKREVVGAKEMGATLYVLIVNEENIRTIEDLKHWENPRIKQWAILRNRAIRTGKPYRKQPPTSGKRLAEILNTMQERYGVIFDFCSKKECADRIIEILERGK